MYCNIKQALGKVIIGYVTEERRQKGIRSGSTQSNTWSMEIFVIYMMFAWNFAP